MSKRIGHNRRIALLHELAPGARFLDVTRDGRAVAYSLLRVDWWADMDIWWYDDRRPADWAAEGRPPLELAARHWVRETEVIEEGLAVVPDQQVMRIRYEQLVADPHPVLAEVAAFAGLDPDSRDWQRALAQVRFPNKNAAWAASLDDAEQETLRVMDGQLRERGYVS